MRCRSRHIAANGVAPYRDERSLETQALSRASQRSTPSSHNRSHLPTTERRSRERVTLALTCATNAFLSNSPKRRYDLRSTAMRSLPTHAKDMMLGITGSLRDLNDRCWRERDHRLSPMVTNL